MNIPVLVLKTGSGIEGKVGLEGSQCREHLIIKLSGKVRSDGNILGLDKFLDIGQVKVIRMVY